MKQALPRKGPYKVIFVGVSGVGKTCLFNSMLTGRYQPQGLPTIGVGTKDLDYIYNNATYRLSLWDTGGAEQYAEITAFYVRDANVVLLCVDPQDGGYLDTAERQMNFVRNLCPTAQILVVATKYDLWKQKMTPARVQEAVAQRLKTANFIATSALEDYQIGDCIYAIVDLIDSGGDAAHREIELPDLPAGKTCC